MQHTKFALISLESTEQEAVLTLSFEHYGLKSPDKILQEEHRDSSLGTCLSTYHCITSLCMTKSPRSSPPQFLHSITVSSQKLDGGKGLGMRTECVSEFEYMSLIYVYRIGERVLGRVISPLYSSGFLLTDFSHYSLIYT